MTKLVAFTFYQSEFFSLRRHLRNLIPHVIMLQSIPVNSPINQYIDLCHSSTELYEKCPASQKAVKMLFFEGQYNAIFTCLVIPGHSSRWHTHPPFKDLPTYYTRSTWKLKKTFEKEIYCNCLFFLKRSFFPSYYLRSFFILNLHVWGELVRQSVSFLMLVHHV